ncbi:uncharacterized protein LOC105172147 [Sesamum indicum]|uniref:Uncharacterized protein LOC105172147 n=1 Tax=Sesamum indicum TaxID=4182 RepID=A0A6I9U2N9_SESIN|nr:uncharacterized protein LOC105172147 [Sesamum indicum]
MMVCSSLCFSTLSRLIPTAYKLPPQGNGRTVEPILQLGRRKTSRRGVSVVTRAGPSSTSYIFAFVFPLSLLAVTIFTSIRIADKLDDKFLEELAINQAILENEDKDEEEDPVPQKEAAPVRSRNRPKRQVESSST